MFVYPGFSASNVIELSYAHGPAPKVTPLISIKCPYADVLPSLRVLLSTLLILATPNNDHSIISSLGCCCTDVIYRLWIKVRSIIFLVSHHLTAGRQLKFCIDFTFTNSSSFLLIFVFKFPSCLFHPALSFPIFVFQPQQISNQYVFDSSSSIFCLHRSHQSLPRCMLTQVHRLKCNMEYRTLVAGLSYFSIVDLSTQPRLLRCYSRAMGAGSISKSFSVNGVAVIYAPVQGD